MIQQRDASINLDILEMFAVFLKFNIRKMYDKMLKYCQRYAYNTQIL